MSPKETVSTRQLLKYISTLVKAFGIRPDIPHQVMSNIRRHFWNQAYSQCILEIKLIFKLHMTLRIGYVKEKGAFPNMQFPTFDVNIPSFADSSFSIDGYLEELQKSTDQLLSQLESWRHSYLNPFHEPDREPPAWVDIPENIPLWGTPAFDQSKVTMYVRNSLKQEQLETFAYCVAHEMAHILLASTRSPLFVSEVATDLLVMVLGFSDIMKYGRETFMYRFGYLDSSQFQLAYDEIRRLRRH